MNRKYVNKSSKNLYKQKTNMNGTIHNSIRRKLLMRLIQDTEQENVDFEQPTKL